MRLLNLYVTMVMPDRPVPTTNELKLAKSWIGALPFPADAEEVPFVGLMLRAGTTKLFDFESFFIKKYEQQFQVGVQTRSRLEELKDGVLPTTPWLLHRILGAHLRPPKMTQNGWERWRGIIECIAAGDGIDAIADINDYLYKASELGCIIKEEEIKE